MKVKEFLSEVTLENGYCSTTKACDIIGKMPTKDFQELCKDMEDKQKPKLTVIKIESMISGKVNLTFDNPDVFEKVKNQFFEILKGIE